MDERRKLTLACLMPTGRAGKNAEVTFAHATGRFLAERTATLMSDAAQGEVAEAMASGSFHAGGRFRIVVSHKATPPRYPAPVELTELDEGQLPSVWLGAEADAIWAMPPRVADLDRYFATWLAADGKPVVCLAQADEFRLLRGIIEEVVRVRRPRHAQRIIFAASAAEGWELLEDLLRGLAGRGPTAAD